MRKMAAVIESSLSRVVAALYAQRPLKVKPSFPPAGRGHLSAAGPRRQRRWKSVPTVRQKTSGTTHTLLYR